MTDQSIPATNGQPVTPPTEPMKKTFFGGEVAFDDPTAFKAVDAPQLSEQSPIEETEEKVEEQEMNRSEVVETEQGEEIWEAEKAEEIEDIENVEDISEHSSEEQAERETEFDFNPFEEEQQQELEIPNSETSQWPIIDKFLGLIHTARTIFTLQENQQFFTLLWGKTPTSTLEYHVYLVEDEEFHLDLFIKKVDTNTETQEEDEHLLQRSYHTQLQTLNIFVDEILLYQYQWEKNPDERILLDKFDKFWLLFDAFYVDLNKAYLEKKETENKKKQLHEIFRNF